MVRIVRVDVSSRGFLAYLFALVVQLRSFPVQPLSLVLEVLFRGGHLAPLNIKLSRCLFVLRGLGNLRGIYRLIRVLLA